MTYIPAALRRLVYERARGCCEYCLVHEEDTSFSHEVDHFLAEKHGGTTTEDNLCLSCFECNRHKGSDIASYDLETDEIVGLFRPCRDLWGDHFRLDNIRIQPLTPTGRVTVHLLQLNSEKRLEKRLMERERLRNLGRYPGNIGSDE